VTAGGYGFAEVLAVGVDDGRLPVAEVSVLVVVPAWIVVAVVFYVTRRWWVGTIDDSDDARIVSPMVALKLLRWMV
jgi:hypothetical protein